MLSKFARFLPQSGFARSAARLIGGSTLAQVIVVAASPILTRLYAPADIGIMASFAAVLAIFVVVSSLRYDLAIPLPEFDTEAVGLVAACLMAVVGISGFSAVKTKSSALLYFWQRHGTAEFLRRVKKRVR